MSFLFIAALLGLVFAAAWSMPVSLERTLSLVRVSLFIGVVLLSLGFFGAITAFFIYFIAEDHEYEINETGIIKRDALSKEYEGATSRFLIWIKQQEAKQRETTTIHWHQISRMKLHKRHAIITIYRWLIIPTCSLACTPANCEQVAQVLREQLAARR
ncbi:hypothetical protein CJ255_19810 [Candidatus Viridilinea mediisalina]|uniref:YcxB-like protein domain-containing protein n=2 Tax=Candidatus Viridilinea mediisalina TaxID=2024553 RepID=A0A2A6RED2_9CHLR|nr:hypothetical protein CJ255_19810 [Candidatus Viridilinea mediisalina]